MSVRIFRGLVLGGSAIARRSASGRPRQTQLPASTAEGKAEAQTRAGACSSAHALKGRPRLSKLK